MLHKYQNLRKYIKMKEEKIETFRPTISNTNVGKKVTRKKVTGKKS